MKLHWFHCADCFVYKASYPSKVTMYIVTTLALLHILEVYQDMYKVYYNYPGCGSKKPNRNNPKTLKTEKVRKLVSEKVRKPVKPVVVPPPPDLPCCREPELEMPPSCRPEPVRSCPPPPSCHQQRPPPSCGGEPERVEPPKKKKKSGKKKSKTESGKKKSKTEGSRTSQAGDKKKRSNTKKEKVVKEEPMCCH